MNDLDLKHWRDLQHVKTSSIWVGNFSSLRTRDFGISTFHGRYHPEIPYQMMMRYTRPLDLVWDPFAGGGTTIDVARLLNRRCIANDLQSIRSDVIKADSTIWRPDESVQLAILHPPYWQMIRFSEDRSDLSNAETIESFLFKIRQVLDNVYQCLESHRYAVLVISDYYKSGELVPLGSLLYTEFKAAGFKLKGKIIKDFGETRGTETSNAVNANLWRYRCLKFGLWELGIDEIYVYQRIL